MAMSQNFPMFFDGIVAGDPVYDQQAIGLSETNGVEAILERLQEQSVAAARSPSSRSPRRSRPDRSSIRRSRSRIRRCSRRRCCRPAMRSTASPTASSTTCRPAEGQFDPATATYTSGAMTLPPAMHRPEDCDLSVGGSDPGGQEDQHRDRAPARDSRSARRPAPWPRTTSPTSRRATPGTAAG